MINKRYATLVACQDRPHVVVARELQNRLPAFLKTPVTKVMLWLGHTLNITWQIAKLVGVYRFGKLHQIVFRHYIAPPIYKIGQFASNVGIFMHEIRNAQLDIDKLRDQGKDLALQFDSALLDSVFGRKRRYPSG